MKKIFALLFLVSSAALGQVAIPVNNSTTTGTILNETAIVNSSNQAVMAGTSNTTVPTYIVAGGAGTSGQAQLAVLGQTTCLMDATVSGAGWYYIVNSTTTAGYCHPQSAAPSANTWVIGYLAATSTTSGSVAVVNVNSYIYGGRAGAVGQLLQFQIAMAHST